MSFIIRIEDCNRRILQMPRAQCDFWSYSVEHLQSEKMAEMVNSLTHVALDDVMGHVDPD